MGLTLLYSQKVRQALKAPASVGIDVLLLVGLSGLIAGMAMFFRNATAPKVEHVHISLSLWSLPKYTFWSLMRGFAAYSISLIFTLIYGTIAAHNRTAEKFMIPALDILQSIPVLGFMPGLVLAMISLFPSRQFGLEFSCIVMIFTAQAWNMTFSFHGSLRSIPTALREASALAGLSGWQIFSLLEVPASMIGLVWNSMMSMAGGWFFLTVNEAFQLTIGGEVHDFRLPGIGSYMSVAIEAGNTRAMIGAVVAMIAMIVLVDQIFWRPIVVWSQRFKLEDSAAAEVPRSWMVDLFKRSPMIKSIQRWLGEQRHARMIAATQSPKGAAAAAVNSPQIGITTVIRRILTWLVLGGLAVLAVIGLYKLVHLFLRLPIYDSRPGIAWKFHEDWITVVLALLASFARTSAAVILGAAWTLPVGILIGLSPKWSQRLQPITQVAASFPAPMLFPLVYMVLIVLHIPFTIGCVALMLLGAQWYILFNVIAGASSIPAELKEVGGVYGMTRAQLWKRLYIPSVFPFLVTGLVTAAGGAWNATIVAEALTIPGGPGNAHAQNIFAFGLGSMISQAAASEKYPLLAASVIVMSLFVVLLNRVIWKRLYRLAESRYSLNT